MLFLSLTLGAIWAVAGLFNPSQDSKHDCGDLKDKVELVARMGEICLLVLICQVLVCILQGTISRRFCY